MSWLIGAFLRPDLFHTHQLHSRLSLLSHGNLSEVFWPFGMGEQVLEIGLQVIQKGFRFHCHHLIVRLQMHRGEIRLDAEDTSFSLGDCLLVGTELAASAPGHWIADKVRSPREVSE